MANVNLIDSSNIKVKQNGSNISLDLGSEVVVDSIRSKNMFDKGDITTGLTYTNTGTTIGLTETFVQYTYIPVKPNTKYTIGTTTDYTSETNYRLQILEYNSSKTFIKRNQGLRRTYTITTTANTYFVRLGASTITKDQLQFEESDTQTTYAPYQNLTGQEIYSTGETVIGTWIDGKTLYRKVVSDTVSTTNGTWKDFNPFSSNEIDTIVSLVGTFTYASGATVSIPYTRTTDANYSNREYILANVHKYNGTLSVIAYHPSNYSGLISGQKFRITIEYTKN